MMKAVRIATFGGPDVLRYEDAPIPEPGPGEALVRVYAAGVNPIDWKTREGQLEGRVHHRLPLVLGWDVAGQIERLGPGSSGFAPNESVFGRSDMSRDGSYAEMVVVRTDELARQPVTLRFAEAAAVPLAALTAWQALFEAPAPYSSLELQSGQTLLLHGAAGGVGTFALQLAKWKGAKRPELCHDLARLELALAEVFDAPETEPLSDAEIAAVPAESWEKARLAPIEAFRLLSFRYPVNAYLQSVRDEDHNHPDLKRKDTYIAIYRRDYSVWRHDLSAPAFDLLTDLVAGKPLGKAVAAALARGGRRAPTTDQLFRWFREWAAGGVFKSVRLR